MDTRELLKAPPAETPDLTTQLMSGHYPSLDNAIAKDDDTYLDPSMSEDANPFDQYFNDLRDREDEHQASLAGVSLAAYRVKRKNEEIVACRKVKAALNKSPQP